LFSFNMRKTAWFPAFFGAVPARDWALLPRNIASERLAELPIAWGMRGVARLTSKES